MASGSDSDEGEETINRGSRPEGYRHVSDEITHPTDQALLSAQKQAIRAEDSAELAESAVDITFAFIEISLAILTLVAVMVSATTSFSLYPTAGGLMALVAIFEVVRRAVKTVDQFRRDIN